MFSMCAGFSEGVFSILGLPLVQTQPRQENVEPPQPVDARSSGKNKNLVDSVVGEGRGVALRRSTLWL